MIRRGRRSVANATPELHRLHGPEEQGPTVGSERRTAAEDQGGQRDEPDAAGHVVLERVELLEGQVGAAETGEDATQDHAPIAGP